MKRIRITPGRYIALGFIAVIITGSILLLLPISHHKDVVIAPIDAFFTATSAVCVTGLIAIDAKDNFSLFGQTVLAILIQIGGLGITSIGAGVMMLSRHRINMRDRTLIKEALNYGSYKGVLGLVKSVLLMTLFFELTGMLLSFFVFVQDYPVREALGISAFHSIAAFNNSGFDILGGMKNLIPYAANIPLNLITSLLIIFGGLGFFSIKEIIMKRSFQKLSLHTKVVIIVSVFFLAAGTLVLKYTEDITWLGALFTSTSARTAGFSTFAIGGFSNAGLLVLIILMFIGASPGSTGGGIKTTTFFAIFLAVTGVSTNTRPRIFRRSLPRDLLYKAFVILSLALTVVLSAVFLLCVAEPGIPFSALLFEVVSAFGTVGLSTGITPDLTGFSKTVLIFTMYIGRLGPMTIATLWLFRPPIDVAYAEEQITIG